jgi:hypothetical protein
VVRQDVMAVVEWDSYFDDDGKLKRSKEFITERVALGVSV